MKRNRAGKIVRARKRKKKRAGQYDRGGDFFSLLVTVQEDEGDPFVNHRGIAASTRIAVDLNTLGELSPNAPGGKVTAENGDEVGIDLETFQRRR